MIEPRAICAKCKHHCFTSDIWYDQYCHAVERERGIDPVNGKKCFVFVNDLGCKCFTDDRYPYCRDINPEGECLLYEENIIRKTLGIFKRKDSP